MSEEDVELRFLTGNFVAGCTSLSRPFPSLLRIDLIHATDQEPRSAMFALGPEFLQQVAGQFALFFKRVRCWTQGGGWYRVIETQQLDLHIRVARIGSQSSETAIIRSQMTVVDESQDLSVRHRTARFVHYQALNYRRRLQAYW